MYKSLILQVDAINTFFFFFFCLDTDATVFKKCPQIKYKPPETVPLKYTVQMCQQMCPR